MKKTILGISLMMLSAFGMTAMAQNNDAPKKIACSPCPAEQCAAAPCGRPCAAPCDSACNPCPADCNACPVNGVCPADSAACAAPCYGKKGRGHHGGKDLRCVAGERRCDRSAAGAYSYKGSKMRRDLHKDGHKINLRANLFNGIELTADQQSRLDELDRKIAADRKEARQVAAEKKNEAKADMRKAREEARDAYNKGVKEILTKEQYAKYELNCKEMQVRREARGDARKLKSDMRKASAAAKSDMSAKKSR